MLYIIIIIIIIIIIFSFLIFLSFLYIFASYKVPITTPQLEVISSND